MRIGLIGDTHWASRRRLAAGSWDRWLSGAGSPDAVLDRVAVRWGPVDEIWHSGDLAGPEVLAWLAERFGVPVRAVRGNADRGDWAQTLPLLHEDRIAGRRLAMIHGWGSGKYMIDRIVHRIGWDWDVVIFGHTHRAMAHRLEDVLFVNPGSPTDTRFAPQRTVGVLELSENHVEAQILDLDAGLTSRDDGLE